MTRLLSSLCSLAVYASSGESPRHTQYLLPAGHHPSLVRTRTCQVLSDRFPTTSFRYVIVFPRIFRAGEPLSPIATLHYIRPVIQELLAQPADPDYIHYLCDKLTPIAPDFVTAAHQLQ